MSDPELAMKCGLNCTDGAKRQIFRFNTGKSMRLFPERHPYMPKGCGDCVRKLNLAYNPTDKKCQVCDEIRRQAKIKQNGELYQKLLDDPNYKDVEFNPKTGALKATHDGHTIHKNDDKRYFKEQLTGDDLENEFMQLAFESGHSVIFNDEKKIGEDGNQLSSLDMIFDGVVMDIKSITEKKYHYGSAIKGKNSQLFKYNLRDDIKIKADTLCLFFYDADMYTDICITEGLRWIRNKGYNISEIKYIICALRTTNGIRLIKYTI